jgi:prefoldin alpha subunit
MNQEIMMKIEGKYRQAGEFEEQLNLIEQQVVELTDFQKHLDEIEKSKETKILASLGKGIFLKSEIKDKKLFVDVGSGIIIRKTAKEAVEIVQEQLVKLNEFKVELGNQINSLNGELQDLMKQSEEK